MRFCVYCGQDQQGKVLPDAPDGVPKRKEMRSEKKEEIPIWIPVLLAIILVVCALVVLVLFLHSRSKDSDEPAGELVETLEERIEQETERETETTEKEKETKEKLSGKGIAEAASGNDGDAFLINSDTVADYSTCLDPKQYQYYDSGIVFFSFYYPVNLFNRVEVDEEDNSIVIGNQIAKNEQSVQFYASDGTEALFQVMNRMEAGGVDPKLGEIYAAENQQRFHGEGVGDLHYENGYGCFFLSGYQNGNVIYEFVNMNNNQIYRFFSITPPWTDINDRAMKEYVTTCMERMTGFAYSKEVPTYEEFLEKNAERFRDSEWASETKGIMLSPDVVDFVYSTFGEAKSKYTMVDSEFTHAGLYQSTAIELGVSGQYDGYHNDTWIMMDSDECTEAIGKVSAIFPGYQQAMPIEKFAASVYADGEKSGSAVLRYEPEGYMPYGGEYYEIYIPTKLPSGMGVTMTLIVSTSDFSGTLDPSKTVILVRDYVPLS